MSKRGLCLLLALPRAYSACISALDCGLNGECVAGICSCDAGWRGAVCGELDLLPANKAQRGLYLEKVST